MYPNTCAHSPPYTHTKKKKTKESGEEEEEKRGEREKKQNGNERKHTHTHTHGTEPIHNHPSFSPIRTPACLPECAHTNTQVIKPTQ